MITSAWIADAAGAGETRKEKEAKMTVARCSCNAYRWCGAGEAKKCQNDCERLFAICIMRDRQVLCDAIVNCAGRNLNIYDLHSHWKKAIINVWGQKSGNFLQTFEPDSYLITAISKFVLHSGKNHKTLAKNKQNKNWQNYWWLRLWYFWQNEKKPQTKCKLQSHKVVDGPFGEGGAGFLNGQHLQLLLASICSLCILNHNQ